MAFQKAGIYKELTNSPIHNIETVVLLSREKVDGHINIDLDVEKLESKAGTASYPEIKDYV